MTQVCRKPVPPGRVINNPVFAWWDYPLFLVLTGLALSAVLYSAMYWFSSSLWRAHPILCSLITFVGAVIIVNHFGRWFLLLLMKKPVPIAARAGWNVGVVTTFVPGVESHAMLEKTLTALVAMDYPHDTWVLDEGDTAEVKLLCQQLGARHFSRKGQAHYQTERGDFQTRSKHGNYNAWLDAIGFAQYGIVASFDPDHVPDRTFLTEVLGYFDDPTVGYVQAPQVYGNQYASLVARGAAEETYAYNSSIQMASYGMGYPIVVGCHNTHRVTALRDVGGFAPHDADDLLITLFYRTSGWQGVYVPKILARGQTPETWRAYLTQQRRWARSVLDIKLNVAPRLDVDWPLASRVMSRLHGVNYIHRGLLIPLEIGLLGYLLITGMATEFVTHEGMLRLGIVAVALQLDEFYRQRFYLDWRTEWGLHWRAGLLNLAKCPSLLAALVDVLLNRRFAYETTPKTRASSSTSSI